jgi:hypothetical protein
MSFETTQPEILSVAEGTASCATASSSNALVAG